jgi:hypothetical protein
VIDQPGAPAPPGFWVEGPLRDWVYFYNFRGLGPWQERDTPSDATVVLNLVAPGSWRPVLIAEARFQEVRARLQAGDGTLIDLLARRMGATADVVRARLREADIGLVTVPRGRILLPGPYRGCATDRFRAGLRP